MKINEKVQVKCILKIKLMEDTSFLFLTLHKIIFNQCDFQDALTGPEGSVLSLFSSLILQNLCEKSDREFIFTFGDV